MKVDRVSLDLISVSETNKMFRGSKEFSETALKELSESISSLGVIQPIGIRPDPKNGKKFIIIFGERRYRASQLAGKQNIPVHILDVDESKAFDMQMTENLQREDIHPLREAEGYKHLMEKNSSLTTKELALRFGKSETYIVQRLKLNDLIAEAKKDFLKNKMSLGHALILARLISQDQKEAIRQINISNYGYRSISDLQNFVNRNVINNLLNAPFKLDDADLVKNAGPCTSCLKRTGNAPLLFPDIKDKDRCIDRTCFVTKCNRFLVNTTKEVIEAQPEIVFLAEGYQEAIDEVGNLLKDNKIKTLKEYTDFTENDKSGTKVKGLWVSGNRSGFIQPVYLRKKSADVKDADSHEAIVAKIQTRIKRGRELDQEKVYARILDALRKHPTQKRDCNKKLHSDEEVLLWFIVYDKSGFSAKGELHKLLGLPQGSPVRLYQTLKNIKPEKKALLLRKVMLDQYGGVYPRSEFAFIIRKIAEAYGDIDIKAFEKEQNEIRDKRETRAKERIKLLKQKQD